MFGQEPNDESYSICKTDMFIKGQDVDNIVAGNTLSNDGHPARKFDHMLSNPPFGVEWKKVEKRFDASTRLKVSVVRISGRLIWLKLMLLR